MALAALALAVNAGSMPARAAGERRFPAIDRGRASREYKPQRHRLQDRVRLLSRALDLDARQQAELKKILESQREQVSKVRSDTAVAPADRVLATRAIGEKTADRIRALLNDDQKKKFNPPRQARDAAGPSPTVEDWLNKGKQK